MAGDIVNVRGVVGDGDHHVFNTRLVNAAALGGTGGGNGTTDHRELTEESRNAADQHPQSAITGLVAALGGKADAAEVATVLDGKADKDAIPGLVADAAQEAIDAAMDGKADASTLVALAEEVAGKAAFAHAGQHGVDGADPLTLAAIGAASKGALDALQEQVDALELTGSVTVEHDLLTTASRAAPDQHPQAAITGLVDALAAKADRDGIEDVVAQVVHDAIGDALESKADTSALETLASEVATKADANTVNTALGDKADKNDIPDMVAEVAQDLIDEAVGSKADSSAVETLAGEVEKKADAAAMSEALASKADASSMTSALAGKADLVHAARHASTGDDPITAAAIGAVDAGHLSEGNPHPQYPLADDILGSLWPEPVGAPMLDIYVNPDGGDDANDGLTPETAVKTDARVMRLIARYRITTPDAQYGTLGVMIHLLGTTDMPSFQVRCPLNVQLGFVNDSTNKIAELWAEDASVLLVCSDIGKIGLENCSVAFDGVAVNMHGSWSIANSTVKGWLIFGDTGSNRAVFYSCILTLDALDISGFGARDGVELFACDLTVGDFSRESSRIFVYGATRVFSDSYEHDLYDAIVDASSNRGRLYGCALSNNIVVGALTIYIRTTGNDSTGDGTSARPVATSAGAIALLSSKYPDSFLVSVTLNYGAGTFAFPVLSNVIFTGTAVSIVGQGATVFSSTANIGISSIYAGYLTISNVAFTRTGGFTGAIVQIYGMRATLTNVVFDSESTYATAFIARQGSVVLITGSFTFNAPSTTSFSTVIWATEGGTVVVNTSDFSINSKAGAYALKADGAGRICLRQELTAPVVNYTDSKEIRLQAVSGGMIAGPSASAVAAFVGSNGTAIVDDWSQIYGVSA